MDYATALNTFEHFTTSDASAEQYAEAIAAIRTTVHELENEKARLDNRVAAFENANERMVKQVRLLLGVIADSVDYDSSIEESDELKSLFDEYDIKNPWNNLVCPNCESDLREVGIVIGVRGYYTYTPSDGEDSISVNDADYEETTDIEDVTCGNCDSRIPDNIIEVTTY